MNLTILLFALLITGPYLGYNSNLWNQGNDGIMQYKTWIELQIHDGYLNISGNFKNSSKKDIIISYLLITDKVGKTGNSSSSQKGNVKVKGKEKAVLSNVTYNADQNGTYKVKLFTFYNKKEIGKDSIQYSFK